MHYIGMDVHSKVTALCVLDDNGNIVKETKSKGSLRDLVAYMKNLKKELGGPIKVCYEASTGCGWLYDQFMAMGMKVQVAHPGKLRLIFQSRHKNDRADASKLALILKLDHVPLAHVPSAEIRDWRAFIEYRSKLVVQRGACKNRLRALLRTHAIVAPRSLWTKKGLAWLSQQELPHFQGVKRNMLLAELGSLARQIREAEKALKTFADFARATAKEDAFAPEGVLSWMHNVPEFVQAMKNPSSPPDMSSFIKLRETYLDIFNTVFEKMKLDAVIYPQMRGPLGPLHGDDYIHETVVSEVNIAGLPAVTLPAGFYGSGAPFNLVIVAPQWSEADILALAYAYEQATKHRKAPTLKKA